MLFRSRTAKVGKSRSGAAAVELAILLPFLCFLFVIAVDFARVFYFTLTLQNCARNGAYYASNYPGIYSYASADDAAKDDYYETRPEYKDINFKPTVEVKYGTSYNGPFVSTVPIPDGYVQVTATAPFETEFDITKLRRWFKDAPEQNRILTRTCKMRVAPIIPQFGVSSP